MNLIKVKDIDNEIFYINTNAINKIKISDGKWEEKYLVVLSNCSVSVKESKEIDRMIDNYDCIESIEVFDELEQIEGQLGIGDFI